MFRARYRVGVWRIRRALLTGLLFAAALTTASAAEPQFPALTGRVVDEAGVLSRRSQDQITEWLAQYEQSSKQQVVVATVRSLQGLPIEDFGYRLGRYWGIGEKGRDTGVILLVAPNERTVRIEVGYGLEGQLTDAVSRTIIERDILPAFRQGDYDRGIRAGTLAVFRALGWNAGPTEEEPSGATAAEKGGDLSSIGSLVLIVLFLMFRFLTPFGGRGIYGGPLRGGGMWGSHSRGGFSGHGGSFGGGGASGRW